MDQEIDEFFSWLSATKLDLDAAASTVAEIIVSMFNSKALGGFSNQVGIARTALKNSALQLNDALSEGRQERRPM